jgi:hypothetical protein
MNSNIIACDLSLVSICLISVTFINFSKIGTKESFNFIAKNIQGYRDSKQREGQLYGVYIVQSHNLKKGMVPKHDILLINQANKRWLEISRDIGAQDAQNVEDQSQRSAYFQTSPMYIYFLYEKVRAY